MTPAADPVRGRRRDLATLFAMRIVRMAAYGGLAVVLALYLVEVGLDPGAVGLLLALTLAGDAVISLVLSTRADRHGRRRTLVVGAGLMLLGGVVFAATGDFVVLLAAAIVAVLSPSGNEVGPFLAVEQAALSELETGPRRTTLFAWYQLAGSLATAGGGGAARIDGPRRADAGGAPGDAVRAHHGG
jgi:MFS family permease